MTFAAIQNNGQAGAECYRAKAKRPFFRQSAVMKVSGSASRFLIFYRENMCRKVVEVVAALIWRGGRFMICRRPAHKACGLLWEFVGGKVEAGESDAEALARECREELDVEVNVGAAFMDVTHEYPEFTVHMTLYEASIREGEPKLLEHADIRWISPDEIPLYEFCPADRDILAEIRKRMGEK